MENKKRIATEADLDIIRSKFAFFNNRNVLDIEKSIVKVEKGYSYTWIALYLRNVESGKQFIICTGDYDWIMIPGKLEHHIWGAGRDFEQWDLQNSYTLTKK